MLLIYAAIFKQLNDKAPTLNQTHKQRTKLNVHDWIEIE